MSRSGRLLAVLLAALVALLVGVEAVPHHSKASSKLHRRVTHAKKATHSQQQQQHAPATAFVESNSVASTTTTSATAAQADSSALLASLQHLLAEKRTAGEVARSQLEKDAETTLAVEAALAEKRKALASHNAMLAQFEQCLAQGPAEKRYTLLEQEAKQHEASLLEAQSSVEAKDAALHEAQEALDAERAKFDAEHTAFLAERSKVQAEEAHLKDQRTALEQQAREVAQKERDVERMVQARIEEGVASKLATLQREMQAKADEKLAAVRDAMTQQAQEMLHAQSTMMMEKKASRIARLHEMHGLTSVADSPYAEASDAALLAEESEVVEPTLIETSVASMGPTPAAPAATTAAGGLPSSPIPAPVNNATLSRWARKLAEHCAQLDSCDQCSTDGRCAWCAAGKGSCLALDVNANLRPGSVSGDGLTSGQCASDDWSTSVSARLTLLSLNVFASERGNSTRRFAAIIQLIKKSAADVVALQEVEKWFVHALQAHAYIRNNYHLTEYGPGQAPGGLFILSRYPIAEINYSENIAPGQVEVSQRARVLVAKLGIRGQAVYVATTTLDYRSSENRASSLEFLFRTLKPYRHTFLLGDFNFDEGSKLEMAAIPPSFLDLWPTLVSDKPGYTWDPRANWFAAASDPQSRASRIDRVYLRSNQWMPRAIHLVGCSVSDPLCGAKNLDAKKGVTLIDANKLNPALILAAPTNAADRAGPAAAAENLGMKVPTFLEERVEFLRGTPEHAQVLRALADEVLLEQEDNFASFMEMESSIEASAPKPTFEPDFVPSNHFGLLVQATQFAPRCPVKEDA